MTERSALVPVVSALAGSRVLVVGDVMLDRFVTGTVERISPEAPIPVLKVDDETAMLGGAGNVVRNLTALGAHAAFVAVVGDDEAAAGVRQLVDALNDIEVSLVTAAGRRTSIKTRFLAGTQQMLRADSETVASLAPDHRRAVIDAATELMADCAVVILSDYGKGVLGDGVAEELIAAAKTAGKTVVVDPKGRDYARYRGADVVTPNRIELAEASGCPVVDAATADIGARALIDALGFGAVLATLGADGMVLVPAASEPTILPVEAREVFDVSGAGDTIVATFAAALAAGVGYGQAAALASVAAGIVVGKVGTAVAYADDVVHALHHQDLSSAEAKVLSLAPALDRVETWRRRGLKVGFTNGCFDLLHPGHVSLLAQAREACDRLIVGLNSDASVTRLKAAGRPIQTEAARAAVLASLATVDIVVIFADDTPLDLIKSLRPDVLVKGADYAVDEVVGAAEVQGWGGRVVLAQLEPGHSTTETISRIAE